MIWALAIIAIVIVGTRWGADVSPRPPKHIREQIEWNRKRWSLDD